MKLTGLWRLVPVALGALAVAAAFAPMHARAGSFVQGTIIAPEGGGGPSATPADSFLPPPQVGCFDPKPDARSGRLKNRVLGKVKMSSSTKPGDGGASIQLNLVNVDCDGTVPYMNTDCTGVARPFPCCTGVGTGTCATAGQCTGPATEAGGAGKCDCVGNIMELQVSQQSAPAVIIRVGIPYNLVAGKSIFPATGTNKTNGAIFGPLVTAGFNQPLFLKGVNTHGRGLTTPTSCPDPPVTGVDPCLAGETFGRLGLVQNVDATLPGCTANTDCPLADICANGGPFCVPEPCTMDSDCNQDGTGDGGTLQCGADNNCCDATVEGVACSGAH
jgi:hypothetical protein